MSKGGPTDEQKKLSAQQSKLLQEQQDQIDRQKKQFKSHQLDFINRLQGQATTPAGAPAASTGQSGSDASSSSAPFGISGLFSGSSTIG